MDHQVSFTISVVNLHIVEGLSLNCPVHRLDLLWMQPKPLRVYLISYFIFENSVIITILITVK